MKPFDVHNEKYHLGHLFWDSMKRNPDAICQIDAATGESETNASVLKRSIQLARCMRCFGAVPGDVLALAGFNHLDIHIPHYAAVMIGMTVAAVEFGSTPIEGFPYEFIDLKAHFNLCSPKIAFCQRKFLENNLRAIEELGLDTKLICFDHEDYSMKKFIEQYDTTNADKEEFEPLEFDPDKIYAGLVTTGGTTGKLKLAAVTHKAMITKMFPVPYNSEEKTVKLGSNLFLSPVNWISSFYRTISMPFLNSTKLMTSAPPTPEHVIDIINKYKPASALFWPALSAGIIKSEKECDLTCFNDVALSAGKSYLNIQEELEKRMRPDVRLYEAYGQTENLGFILKSNPSGPFGNCGKEPLNGQIIKLVDPDTGKEVTEPNKMGELWLKEVFFSGYYKDPEETAKCFADDGWYRTGDLMYRHEEGSFFFVERLKMLIKYLSYHIFPEDLEAVIYEHPGVEEVVVTSIPHLDDQEHPVACVVRNKGANVTAGEIIDLVANKLPDYQHLRGGVVFIDKIPRTSVGKVARGKLKLFVQSANRLQ